MRKGVTWNDGVPYTAQDIVYTFNLWLKDPSLSGADSATNVASVSATDDYTVIFKFKAPDYRFHQKLRMWGGGSIVAKHIYEKVGPQDLLQLAARGNRPLQAAGLVPGQPDVRLAGRPELLGHQGHEARSPPRST